MKKLALAATLALAAGCAGQGGSETETTGTLDNSDNGTEVTTPPDTHNINYYTINCETKNPDGTRVLDGAGDYVTETQIIPANDCSDTAAGVDCSTQNQLSGKFKVCGEIVCTRVENGTPQTLTYKGQYPTPACKIAGVK